MNVSIYLPDCIPVRQNDTWFYLLDSVTDIIDWEMLLRVGPKYLLGSSLLWRVSSLLIHWSTTTHLTAFSHVFDDTFRLSPSVKTSRVLFVPNNILLYFYNRSVARNVNSRRGPREFRSGYCEEGALVAGLFDSFRAPVPRATFPPASDRRARTKGECAQWRTEGERGREKERE